MCLHWSDGVTIHVKLGSEPSGGNKANLPTLKEAKLIMSLSSSCNYLLCSKTHSEKSIYRNQLNILSTDKIREPFCSWNIPSYLITQHVSLLTNTFVKWLSEGRVIFTGYYMTKSIIISQEMSTGNSYETNLSLQDSIFYTLS